MFTEEFMGSMQQGKATKINAVRHWAAALALAGAAWAGAGAAWAASIPFEGRQVEMNYEIGRASCRERV